MRLRRILAAVVVTTLAAPAALLTSPTTASAATATQIVGGTDGKGWIYRSSSYASQPGAPVFGDTFSLSINVVAGSSQVYDGTLTVQRQLPGKDWKTIKTSSSAYLYDSIKAVGNANYRVLYSGSGDYAPSSAGVSSQVQRKLDYSNVGGRTVVLAGKVSPKYKGKIAIFKQQGKKWKKFKTIKSNRKGKFRTPLPAPRSGRYYFKIEIPASRAFAKTQSGKFYTYSVRASARGSI
ncbi:hypothetical protein [Nocardioides caricicola]|uniref:Uncharacterized protein n=1 Tax=Nocardioides caricicola TaxID=634770 RepID=A0ABW0N839_9ACTN